MSIKIRLDFETRVDLELLSSGISVRLIRLIATLQLKTVEDWTCKYKAIIDTGNPISVIPHFIWSKANSKWLSPKKSNLYGIGSGCVSGRLAETTVIFLDEKLVSKPLIIKAHLLDDDGVPFLIGFEDILTKAKLICDYHSHRAYLEWK